MYLDVGAVRFMEDKPFIFTSGWASPVYNDSRWLMSFPDVRSALMDFAVHTIERDIGRDKIDSVAGGETAGIPSMLVKSGDIITEVGQKPVTNPREFRAAFKDADLKRGVILNLISGKTSRFAILKDGDE